MNSAFRTTFLFVIVGALIWLTPAVSTPLANAFQNVTDHFDRRPERAILFIGNSRTSYHDMPYMVRKIADSADAAYKYRIVMHAPGGATFQDHWNTPAVHDLLNRKWQYVVFQAQSSEHVTDADNDNFYLYGAKLINEAQVNGSAPLLYVNWRYADNYEYYSYRPDLRTQYYNIIQLNHERLAARTGAGLVNVGKAWEELLYRGPSFPLYADGNHPTIQGSYLAAMIFYRYFCGRHCGDVSYAPWGVGADEAAVIKTLVQKFQGSANGS